MASFKLRYHDDISDDNVYEDSLNAPLNDVLDHCQSLQDNGFQGIHLEIQDDDNRPEIFPSNSASDRGVLYNYRVCFTDNEGYRDEIMIEANPYERENLLLHSDIRSLLRLDASNIIVFQQTGNTFGEDIESFGHPIAVYNLEPDSFPLELENKYEFILDAPNTSNKFQYMDFVGTPQEAKEKSSEIHALETHDRGPTPEHAFLSKLGFDFSRLVDKIREVGERFTLKSQVKNDPVSQKHMDYIQDRVRELYSKGKSSRLIKGSIRQYCNQYGLGPEFLKAGNRMIRKTFAQQAL